MKKKCYQEERNGNVKMLAPHSRFLLSLVIPNTNYSFPFFYGKRKKSTAADRV